jgi:hypothetical protein
MSIIFFFSAGVGVWVDVGVGVDVGVKVGEGVSVGVGELATPEVAKYISRGVGLKPI